VHKTDQRWWVEQAAAPALSMVDIKVQVNDGEPIESAIRRFKVPPRPRGPGRRRRPEA
jgi:hypothetical protein